MCMLRACIHVHACTNAYVCADTWMTEDNLEYCPLGDVHFFPMAVFYLFGAKQVG